MITLADAKASYAEATVPNQQGNYWAELLPQILDLLEEAIIGATSARATFADFPPLPNVSSDTQAVARAMEEATTMLYRQGFRVTTVSRSDAPPTLRITGWAS